jgi:hypothetical protein
MRGKFSRVNAAARLLTFAQQRMNRLDRLFHGWETFPRHDCDDRRKGGVIRIRRKEIFHCAQLSLAPRSAASLWKAKRQIIGVRAQTNRDDLTRATCGNDSANVPADG